MTRRPVAVLLLAIIAALGWAPLAVSAATPKPSTNLVVEPEPSGAEGVPAPSATPAADAPPVASLATPTPLARTASVVDATSASSAPVARAVASPPRGDAAAASEELPAAASVAAPMESASVAEASVPPSASVAPPQDGLSRTMLLTLVGVVASMGMLLMILGTRERGKSPVTAGSVSGVGTRPRSSEAGHPVDPDDPAGILARAARRSRLSAADDPILRSMGLGPDVPPPSRRHAGAGHGPETDQPDGDRPDRPGRR